MIKVTVTSAETRNMQGIGKVSNKPYNLFFQAVYFHLIDKAGNPAPFPEKVEIILEKDEVGNPKFFQPGSYLLHPNSLYVDKTGNLAVAPRLVPAVPAKS